MSIHSKIAYERERSRVIEESRILENSGEFILTQITNITAQICNTPVSLVTILDQDIQHNIANYGLPDVKEIPRVFSFCDYAILENSLMEINDASKDERFIESPYVRGEPHVKFYAGFPLSTEKGIRLGTLCAIGMKPKKLSGKQKEVLKKLASIAMRFLNMKILIMDQTVEKAYISNLIDIRNKALEKELQVKNILQDKLALLHKVSLMMQSSTTVIDNFSILKNTCEIFFPEHVGCFYLFEERTKTQNLLFSWGKNLKINSLKNEIKLLKEIDAQNFFTNVLLTQEPFNLFETVLHEITISKLFLGSLIIMGPSNKNIDWSLASLDNSFIEQFSLSLYNGILRKKLEYESTHDPLTRLFNRRYFNEICNTKISKLNINNSEFSLCLLDLDFFKAINDTYGHQIGDKVLHKIGQLLLGFIRSTDLIFRYGGEEFIIILFDMDEAAAAVIANRLRKRCASLKIVCDNLLIENITLSIGVSSYPKHGRNIKTLLKKSDTALYQAKQTGRDKVCIYNFTD